MTTPHHQDRDLDIRIGRRELVLSQRYEVASIANDILIALWFIIGSFLFFSEATATVGTVLFVVGSLQMLIRPSIRLARRTHLQRVGTGAAHTMDF